MISPDGKHAPQNRRPHEQDIYGCERQVPQSELDWCKREVRNQVDRKRDGDSPWYFSPKRLQEYKTETDHDDGVQDPPDQANCGRCGCPIRFREPIIPFEPGHGFNDFLQEE